MPGEWPVVWRRDSLQSSTYEYMMKSAPSNDFDLHKSAVANMQRDCI